jgi:hypothetical protein
MGERAGITSVSRIRHFPDHEKLHLLGKIEWTSELQRLHFAGPNSLPEISQKLEERILSGTEGGLPSVRRGICPEGGCAIGRFRFAKHDRTPRRDNVIAAISW